ncbi:MAG: hydantoinase/oxoprolinase family protein [Sporichthyaceae bacterium]|nr:hydantoinase/oxoprolinase family protein [Sporichthyaceae bacterium]
MARIRIGIDTGGTFTDVVAFDAATGRLLATKTASTPAEPATAFMAGIAKVLGLLGLDYDAVEAISHGTTVATNQLLEDDIGELGFITTEGFEFVLEIARQAVPDGYGNSYFWVKPPRIVPVHRVSTVPGRLDHAGAEVRPFDTEQAEAVARAFHRRGISTIGVCLLHSYANPAHELAMREVLAREHPQAVVSLSCEVLPEYREYERSMTTLVDAAVKPRIAAYVAGIRDRLDAEREGLPFYVMKSNGGVLSATEVVHQPITTVLSGPAAGALGAALVASVAGYDSVLTLDGGGTSTDVSVIVGGQPSVTTEGQVGRYPTRIPMIDVVTVGAGGGSIAAVSPEGTLKVGPRSAGADPGPLCYRKGGTEPTVTDACVALGRIPPHLLGGEIPLDVAAAEAGLAALAGQLGMDPDRVADGILEIFAWNQANAIRQVTVKRGLDVREFMLTTFGGSGSLLACRLVDILGLRGVLVPRDPGTVSAFGLLTVDVRNDYVRTRVSRADELDLDATAKAYEELAAQAAAALDREGFGPDAQRLVRSADLRYYGQAFEVRVDAPAGPVDGSFAATVLAAFHDAHERLYGYCYRDQSQRHPVEWVNLRVTGIGPITRPALVAAERGDGRLERALIGIRPVRFDEWADVPSYDRARLAPGDLVAGPAVIEEFGSTVPIHPGFTAAVDDYTNLVVTR